MRLMSKFRIAALLALLAFVPVALAQSAAPPAPAHKLAPPAKNERLKVAFVLTEGAVMIDFAGPWEVFQDVMLPSRGPQMSDQHPFELYTVSDTKAPLHASDGMQIVPDYTFDDAPTPQIVVIPAQSGRSPRMLAWVRKMTGDSQVVMSVCTGAFVLAEAGLLDGKQATTHHGSYNRLQTRFPKITVERGRRYVQSDPVIFTAGGLSSGIDLALHVVELYFGRDAAQATANMMEYEGTGWKGDGAAAADFTIPPPVYASDRLAEGPLGKWQGVIASPEGDFHVVLHLWKEKDGTLGGVVDSVDDDVYGLLLQDVVVNGSAVSFTIPSVMGSYEGSLDGTAIRGTFKQHGSPMRLDFERARGEGNVHGASL